MQIIRVTAVPISLKILHKDQPKFIDRYFNVVAVFSEGKETYDAARDEGIITIPLNMTRHFTPFRDLIAHQRMLLTLLRLFYQQIIYVSPILPMNWLMLFASLREKVNPYLISGIKGKE